MSATFLIATSNRGKVREFKKLVGTQLQFFTPTDPTILERVPKAPKVAEDGNTYFENGLAKALRYYETYRMPVLSDDSGLEVDCLDGGPGVHSAVYGGENLSPAERWAHLLTAIRKSGAAQPWSARFRCVLCYFDGKNTPWFVQGVCEGRILPEPVGTEGFGYDPLFWSEDLKMGFGSATEEQKNPVSHRGRAIKAFQAEYSRRFSL